MANFYDYYKIFNDTYGSATITTSTTGSDGIWIDPISTTTWREPVRAEPFTRIEPVQFEPIKNTSRDKSNHENSFIDELLREYLANQEAERKVRQVELDGITHLPGF